MVEAPHTAVSGGERDRAQRQISIVNETLRGKQAMRLRNRDGRRAEMLQKQAPQMTLTHSQTIREIPNAGGIERTRSNFPQRA